MHRVRDALTERYNHDAFQRIIYTESHDDVACGSGKNRLSHDINPGVISTTIAGTTRPAAARHRTPDVPVWSLTIHFGHYIWSDITFGTFRCVRMRSHPVRVAMVARRARLRTVICHRTARQASGLPNKRRGCPTSVGGARQASGVPDKRRTRPPRHCD